MKNKHCTYEEKIAFCNFRNYHYFDNFFNKSRVTATATGDYSKQRIV